MGVINWHHGCLGFGHGGRSGRFGNGGSGWHGAADGADKAERAASHGGLREAQVGIVFGHGLDPGLATAGDGQFGQAGIRQIAVVAGSKAVGQIVGVAAGAGLEAGGLVGPQHQLVEEIRVHIAKRGAQLAQVATGSAKVLGPLAMQSNQFFGKQTKVVLGKCIAIAITCALKTVGDDMRHTVGCSTYRGRVLGGQTASKQSRSDSSHKPDSGRRYPTRCHR